MAKVHYRVQFDIPEQKLGTVMGLISGEVSNMIIRDTTTIKAAGPSPSIVGTPLRSVAKRGSVSAAAVAYINALGVGKVFERSHLGACLKKNGGNESSAGPTISGLARDGYVRWLSSNRYLVLKKAPDGWTATEGKRAAAAATVTK